MYAGVQTIHEHPGAGDRPYQQSRQHDNGTGSEAFIDPTKSLKLGSSVSSNSTHSDEFFDMLLKHQALPKETEAVKSLFSIDGSSTSSVSSNSLLTKPSSCKRTHHRVGGDSVSMQKLSPRVGQDDLTSCPCHVDSASVAYPADPCEPRSSSQGCALAGQGGQHSGYTPEDDGAAGTAPIQEANMRKATRLQDMQPQVVENALKV
jgi:hypothetical protein